MESKGPDERRPRIVTLKVISWNLLRLTGAGVEDVAAVIEQHRPDLLLLQEATEQLSALPARVGGCFFREPLNGRIYGLAVWSPHPLAPPYALPLPVSRVPGRVPPRVAQIVQLGEVTFANVHLSHGQFLNRWQLLHIANVLDGPAAVVGDYNAIGPIKLAGFEDIGPRQPTHSPNNTISLRLDRCMARGLRCSYAKVLARGRSDHHPIRLDLHVLPAVRGSDRTAHDTRSASKAAGQCGKMGSDDVGRTQPHSRAADVLRDTRCEIPQSEARRGTTAATRAVWHPQAALEGRGQSALMSCVFRKDGTVVFANSRTSVSLNRGQ